MSVETIKITAGILSISGSGILAFRVTGILSALSFIADVHEINIQQLMPNQQGDILSFGDSTAHVDKAKKKGLLITGFVFITLSGALQLIVLVMANS